MGHDETVRVYAKGHSLKSMQKHRDSYLSMSCEWTHSSAASKRSVFFCERVN